LIWRTARCGFRTRKRPTGCRGSTDGNRGGCFSQSRCDLRLRPLPLPERRKSRRRSENVKTVWHATLRRAKVRYFRIYDLRSTYATRLSAGGVADEWVTQLLRQGDAKVFKKYSQMKREALSKMNRQANEGGSSFGIAQSQSESGFGTVEAKGERKRQAADQTTLPESAGGLVGAGRFECPTPCAQGGFRPLAKTLYFSMHSVSIRCASLVEGY